VWGIAVERMPNSVRARTNYAQGLLVENDINNMRTVVEVLQRGVELSPYDPTALQNLAAGHEQLGEYEQAAECYRRMRDAYPSDWKNWRMYAATLLLLGRWEEAEENYRRAAEINRKDTQDKKDSESAEPHYGMAAALYGQGRDISADAAARNASTIDPNWPEAALGIARNVILDERLRAYPDARRSALTWAELGMKYAESPHPMHHDTLGLCRAAMGDFKGAELASRAGLAASPAGAWGSLHKDRIRDYQRRRTPWPD
jgi:tetratricopeptide (TPR) repeat protein